MQHPVKQTFLDFWPEDWRAQALPHVAVPVTPEAAGALRRAHRFGGDPDKLLAGLARQVAETAHGAPVFLRMGYGSWAGPQMQRFGTLAVCGAQEVLSVLTLPDRRLAEIARRWGQGFDLHVFVRAHLTLTPEDEVRTHVVDNRVVRSWLRHAPDRAVTAPEQAIGVASLMPAGAAVFADYVRVDGWWYLSDVNPVLAPAERRASEAARAALRSRGLRAQT